MNIKNLDHLVLTVANIENSCKFYQTALGMEAIDYGEGRKAVKFGNQIIKFHEYGNEFEPKAFKPQPGSADFCFIVEDKIEAVMKELKGCGIEIEEDLTERIGANGNIKSIYLRDPDFNLIEISNNVIE
jgi:catechol 2,3-dioxygenase-like lactoylglutathione lyase family enzyme